jgi:hypothetical protein
MTDNKGWALAPEGCFSGILLGFRTFSAASSVVPQTAEKKAGLQPLRDVFTAARGISSC